MTSITLHFNVKRPVIVVQQALFRFVSTSLLFLFLYSKDTPENKRTTCYDIEVEVVSC